MKKLFIAVLILFTGLQMNAQETTQEDPAQLQKQMELMSQEIEMDVDTDLLMKVQTNTYVSESPMVLVMGMMVPQSFEKSRKEMQNDQSAEITVSEKGEKEMNGVNVLYQYGTVNAEGKTANAKVYCMEIDAETCLMLMTMVEEGAGDNYTAVVEKAINSVIKK